MSKPAEKPPVLARQCECLAERSNENLSKSNCSNKLRVSHHPANRLKSTAKGLNSPGLWVDENSIGHVSVFFVSRALVGHGFGGTSAPCGSSLFCFGFPPCGLRFPSQSYSATAPKRFLRTLRKCRPSALGSRPRSPGSAQCDPSKIGNSK
jgi:hypothetical protein